VHPSIHHGAVTWLCMAKPVFTDADASGASPPSEKLDVKTSTQTTGDRSLPVTDVAPTGPVSSGPVVVPVRVFRDDMVGPSAMMPPPPEMQENLPTPHPVLLGMYLWLTETRPHEKVVRSANGHLHPLTTAALQTYGRKSRVLEERGHACRRLV